MDRDAARQSAKAEALLQRREALLAAGAASDPLNKAASPAERPSEPGIPPLAG